MIKPPTKHPTFIVIGAHKAATTSLHYYLQRHPEVYLIPNKGTDILAKRHISSLDDAGEYLAQYEDARSEIALGEVSSVYLHGEGIPARIKRLFPNVKLIAILRNPVERAYSHALFNEKMVTKDNIESIQLSILESKELLKPGYYYKYLKTYFELFDRGQIKLMLYDDLATKKNDFFKEILSFIGVNPNFELSANRRYHKSKLSRQGIILNVVEVIRANSNIKPYLKFFLTPIFPQIKRFVAQKTEMPVPPLSEEVRRKLIEIYRHDIVQLQELTGLNCSHWLV
ncbi:sulfotransferase domain-containing protein [Coleofasciculus sp.]|uniref:sulfotransferase domain-containing protein n=1 Tax=Coleofasciculus sp. TaxID=3100458 RepID=UPI0039FA3CB4